MLHSNLSDCEDLQPKEQPLDKQEMFLFPDFFLIQ